MKHTKLDRLIKVNELTEILSVSRATIFRWISVGKLQRVKLSGGVTRFRESDIARLIGGDEQE